MPTLTSGTRLAMYTIHQTLGLPSILKRSLSHRLVAMFVVVGVLPASVVGVVSQVRAASSVEATASIAAKSLLSGVEDSLESVRENQAASIERYFETIFAQIVTFAGDAATVDAAASFSAAYGSFVDESGFGSSVQILAARTDVERFYRDQFLPKLESETDGHGYDVGPLVDPLSDTALALQATFLARNPAPLGSKDSLEAIPASGTLPGIEESAYSKVHHKFHPSTAEFLHRFGYYDIFIVDAQTSAVVYSVYKEVDYATHLLDGPHADSGLAEAFRQGLELQSTDQHFLVDFASYLPSYMAPAGFVASPIRQGGKTIAVAIFQLPIDRISKAMSMRAGLGDGGEAYLVGPDRRMRSDAYRDPTSRSVSASFAATGDTGTVTTEAVALALTGDHGVLEQQNYAGNQVICGYCPVDLGDHRWALLAEVPTSEALASVAAMEESASKARTSLTILITVTVLVLGGLTLLGAKSLASRIMRPIRRTEALLTRFSTGDLRGRIDVESDDELGRMAVALNGTIEGVATALRNDQVDWIVIGGQKDELDRVVALAESAPLGMLFADRDRIVRYANPAADGLAGVLTDAGAQQSVETVGSTLEELLGARNTQEARPSRIERNGVYLETSVTPATDDDGKIFGYVVTLSDVSEAAQASERANELQGAELEKAKALKAEAGVLLKAVSIASEGDLTVEMPPLADPALSEIGLGLAALLQSMREKVREVLHTGEELSSSARELRSISEGMGEVATQTTERAGTASQNSQVIDGRVKTMATATKELEESIREIELNATQAVDVAKSAVSDAQQTNGLVAELEESGNQISEVIQIISTIAAQTNLLALNAAIEAARAGESGKGFAVVANEVKSLAAETANATKSVTNRVGAMQTATALVRKKIQGFSDRVISICESQTEIATAVQQQAATTQAIRVNTSEAASETESVAKSIGDVATHANETREGAQRTRRSAGNVESAAAKLNTIVEAFKTD